MAATDDDAERDRLVAARVAGQPIEHLLGWVEFCGRRLAVGPGVFVPRQRTGFLVDTAATLLPPGPCIVVDLCCGCGAVAAVLAERGGLEVYAVDVDPVAVGYARRNLAASSVALSGDLYEPLPAAIRGRVAVITANAPYVPTDAIALMPPEARDHEPRVAVDGGSDGLDVLRRIARSAGVWLRPGGHLAIEIGTSQIDAATEAFEAAGLGASLAVSEEMDARVIVGRLAPDP